MFKNMYDKILESYQTLAITKLTQIIYNEDVVNQFLGSPGKKFLETSRIATHLNLTMRFEGLGLWQSFVLYRYLKLTLSENTTTYPTKED